MNNDQNIKRLVLIVDDEIVNREMLGFIFSRDYHVIYATNGREALDQIRNNKKMLSLVLLDLLMPEIDGYTVLKELKQNKELSKIPVIVLTSEKSAEIESLKLGAVDFITKPYDMPDVILARVQRNIELSESNNIIQNTSRDELTNFLTKEFFYQFCKKLDKYNTDQKMDAIVFHINNLSHLAEVNGNSYKNEIIKSIANEIKYLSTKNFGVAGRDEDVFYLYLASQDNNEETVLKILNKFNNIFNNSKTRIICGINKDVDKTIDISIRFDRATIACYAIKNNSNKIINYYDTELNQKELLERYLTKDIVNSLNTEHFKIYYQPEYDITGDKPKLSYAEALIRWYHPDLGVITPDIFVPLLEKNGLISKLDNFVWNEVAKHVSYWKEKHNITIPISVNLSKIDFYNDNLTTQFLDLIQKYNITAKDLMIEINESVYLEQSDKVIQVLENLHSRGFLIKIDDFGSGYSSLRMLSELHIDVLKFNLKFIHNLINNEKKIHFMKLIMLIAEYLKVPVVAVGVETEEQFKQIKEFKINEIQGFYLSKPITSEEFNSLIEKELQ